jgi:hypothetical protein
VTSISEVIDDRAPVLGSTTISSSFQQVSTNDTTPGVRITLDPGGQAGDALRLATGQQSVVHALTADDYARGYVDLTLTLPEGWNTVSASLVRADGSTGAVANGTIDIRVDTTAPAAPRIEGVSSDGATLTVAYDTEIPPPSGGSPGHNPRPVSTVVGGQLEVFADGALVKTVAVTSQGSASIDLQGLAPGDYSFTARVIDTSGNAGPTSSGYPASLGGAPAAQGQVLTSDQYGDTLVGGAGADTLNAGQGPDLLTGGDGHDAFAFRAMPWNAGHVTDFAVGTDRLDLSAIFQASGYAGSDPMADGRMSLQSDGAGGTKVYFDHDAADGGDWPFLITTLDHVSSTGLTWAQLSGGAGDASPPPPPPPSGGGSGQVIDSPAPGSTLTGGAGDDTLNASQGPDRLTGAGGADHFVWRNLPWNAGHVTDFVSGQDKLDLRPLFEASGYAGADPIADHWLEFRPDGAGNTQVYFDHDGPDAGDWPFLITTLDEVAPSQVTAGDWLFR